MGMTFQAKVDSTHFTESKAFLADGYSHLTEDDFREWSGVFFDEETQRHYEVDHCIAFPYQLSLSNANFIELFRLIDEELYNKTRQDYGGTITGDEIVKFHQKVVDLLATVHEHDPRVADILDHVRCFGIGLEYVTRSLVMFRDIAESAIEHKLDIQWA